MSNALNSLVQPRLQPLSTEDWPIFQALFTSSLVMQFICPPLTVKQAEAVFQQILHQSIIEYFLITYQGETPDTIHHVGIASYHPCQKNHTIEIGRMLLPEWQNQGLGSNISQQLICRAEQDSTMQQITKRIHKDNIAAIRSAYYRGFTLQSVLPDGFLRFSRLLIKQNHPT